MYLIVIDLYCFLIYLCLRLKGIFLLISLALCEFRWILHDANDENKKFRQIKKHLTDLTGMFYP